MCKEDSERYSNEPATHGSAAMPSGESEGAAKARWDEKKELIITRYHDMLSADCWCQPQFGAEGSIIHNFSSEDEIRVHAFANPPR